MTHEQKTRAIQLQKIIQENHDIFNAASNKIAKLSNTKNAAIDLRLPANVTKEINEQMEIEAKAYAEYREAIGYYLKLMATV
jgi:hypothetical protein